jgi:hypothetical protein
VDVEQAMKIADTSDWRTMPGATGQALLTLAAEVRRLREVLAAYQIEAARERETT